MCYSLGVILLAVLYGRKATSEDVHQYLTKTRYEELDDMIDTNIRNQMLPESLSTVSELAYDCLKEQPDQPFTYRRFHQIFEKLKEASEVQWKHENVFCLQYLMLYGMKARIEDVKHYLAHKELDDRMIDSNLRKQMHPESLSIVLETTYDCLKEQPDKQRPEIVKSLKDAFDIQWKHENHVLMENFAYLKIPLTRIRLATNDFANTYIKSDIYDDVYKAELKDIDRESVLTVKGENKGDQPAKKTIIIKRHNKYYNQTTKDFFAKIEMHSSRKHPNLLSFLGFCDEDSEMILVFECSFKETLVDYLGSTSNRTNLTWEKRIRIGLDIAHGLKYLHNMEAKPSMIFHDILSANVFLDENWTAKIAGFRLSEFNPYPPFSGRASEKLVVDDTYSLGVVLFEILTGKLASDKIYNDGKFNGFASMVRRHLNVGNLKNIVDPRILNEAQEFNSTLNKGLNQDSFVTFSKVASQCVVEHPSERPTLEAVIKSLEKSLHFQVQEKSKNLEAKIADFGLSKVHSGNEHGSTINTTTTIAGTEVYLDPEYAKTGRLKKASDIYSLGVVLFEIFSGRLAYDHTYMEENNKGLAPIAQRHFENGTLKQILDSRMLVEVYELGLTLKVRPDHDSLDSFSKIAYQCLERNQDNRPTIEVVINDLKQALQFQENRMRTLKISLEQIQLAIENFSDDKCIMRGGYGMLYEGTVQDDNMHKGVIVKRFTGHGHALFLKEFEVLFKYNHENIIGLVSYCREMNEKIILYEHASRGCLDRYLKDNCLSWTKRLKICINIAKGLEFLHEGGDEQDVVIHRDIRSSNILLTEDWKAKICGFECALTYPTHQKIEYVIDNVEGSLGYSDPLFQETHTLTKESDIYSLGVILFEVLCGRLACPADVRDHGTLLDVLVKSHYEAARLDEIVFEGIKKQIVLKSFVTFKKIAFQCLSEKREERPTTGDVVVQLQKALEFQEAYEIRKAKLDRTYEEILHEFSRSPEIYSTMRKKDIYNILSKGILLEDDKLLINETTWDLEQSASYIEDIPNYHDKSKNET
ncbi:hypothetical protein QVD17_03254 [Tagetes erecta]|uniref:Protein kinase domain-containing protein n=1 Tax=Tagetes erecta TaxID=13708 RepID=A0AAD8P8H9_TARER|nr:hypothetical protein QVD17_03254 [Tagetes erecta]